MLVVRRTDVTVIEIVENKEMGQKTVNNNSFWIPVKKNKVNIQEIKSTKEPACFQSSLRATLIIGQAFSLIPFNGVLSNNASDVKFVWTSWKCLYLLLSLTGQTFLCVMCIHKVVHSVTSLNATRKHREETCTSLSSLKVFSMVCEVCHPALGQRGGLQPNPSHSERRPELSSGAVWVNIIIIMLNNSAPVIFYGTTCITMLMFLQVARSWPCLVQHVVDVEELDPAFGTTLAKKCNVTCAVVLTLALLEHILSLISAFAGAMVCYPKVNLYEAFVRHFYPWVFNFLPYSPLLGILTQFLHFQSTFIWNFSDLFVICMSYYLTSRLDHVNKKLLAAQGRYLPEVFWRTTREDYGRAAQLVRKVDDVISGIVFISFANNLFFICLQLFNTLEDGIKGTGECSSRSKGSQILGGYEAATYFLFSLVYLITRSVAVSLIASQVNTASTVPAPVLYDVPSPVYCVEVQRFLDQVNGEKLALSGLQFFSVTRSLLLTVAGTIVTYELVMFQFNSPSSPSPAVLTNVTSTTPMPHP